MSELRSNILNAARESASMLNGLGSIAVRELRSRAVEILEHTDFPTVKHEEWKHTPVGSLLQAPFHINAEASSSPVNSPLFSAEAYENVLVFVNGVYDIQHSRCGAAQVVATGLHLGAPENREFVDTHLGTLVSIQTNAFVAANTACITDGALIRIPKNVVVDTPIVILSIIHADTSSVLVQPRNLIEVGENAQVSIIMRTESYGNNATLTNVVTECFLHAGAQCSWTSLQDDHEQAAMIHSMQLHQKAHSVSRLMTVSLSGSVVRNDVGAILAESGAEANMLGVYSIAGSSLVDNHTVMDHRVPHCHSNELFKGVVDGSAHAVFNGKIFVRQDAQKTLAYQSNRNILLSDTATVNTKPQLEIFADDVKCSHGCTIGTIDEEALFYARSRGISEQQARALLLTAFLEDVTKEISDDGVRAVVHACIEQRMSIR